MTLSVVDSLKMESGGEMDLAMSFLSSQLDNGEESTVSPEQAEEKMEVLREQDRFLPIANVARIMKKCIPRTGKVNNICLQII